MIDNLDSRNIYQATTMLLSGRPTKPVDVLFFHGRLFGDDTGLFELAADLVKNKMVGIVALFGNEGERVGSNIPFEANPGKTWYRKQLIEYGVPPDQIIFAAEGGYHTELESDGFLTLAAEKGWLSGAILTQPHQLLRATLGMVRAMQQQWYVMNVYTVTPPTTNWNEIVFGSQGMEAKPRVDHIVDELVRVAKYQQDGGLVSFTELFAYLEKRDRNELVLGPTERGSQLFTRGLPSGI
ncbi:MAG: hypothetical protein Q7R77_01705 [Candidatus Daviesbacteria bacterium]|nr:hypothetical protein [Candidatus Daviesbacteria bacterium]